MIDEARRQAALADEAKRLSIPEWQNEMARAVPDRLVRDIVGDHSRGTIQPSSTTAPPREAGPVVPRVEPRPLELRSAFELGIIDRLCEKFVGGPNSIK